MFRQHFFLNALKQKMGDNDSILALQRNRCKSREYVLFQSIRYHPKQCVVRTTNIVN